MTPHPFDDWPEYLWRVVTIITLGVVFGMLVGLAHTALAGGPEPAQQAKVVVVDQEDPWRVWIAVLGCLAAIVPAWLAYRKRCA